MTRRKRRQPGPWAVGAIVALALVLLCTGFAYIAYGMGIR